MAIPEGTIIHRTPLRTSDLPQHDGLKDTVKPQGADRPQLASFIVETLLEGDKFIDTVTWAGIENAKASSPSTARVEIGKRSFNISAGADHVDFQHSIIPSRKINPPQGVQFWYGRKSQHENAAKEGTASFAELDAGLRQDHSPQERAYTPDIFDCVELLDYADQIAVTSFDGVLVKADLKVYEMAHDLGAMLAPRVFGIAVVSGQLEADQKFVVVQLPLDLSDFPGAMYSNRRNLTEGKTKTAKKRCTQGFYASIERGIQQGVKTEWTMVTSSDAGGNLPLWLQNKVAPGKVVHDVGLFMKWIHQQRPSEAVATPADA